MRHGYVKGSAHRIGDDTHPSVIRDASVRERSVEPQDGIVGAAGMGERLGAVGRRSREFGAVPVITDLKVVPGLFQTADYARAVIEAGVETLSGEEVQRSVELRLARQKILDREDPPRVWFVVEEAALRRRPGGPQVMATQLERLIELVAMPHVTLQVMPHELVHAAMYGAFHHLRLPAGLPDIVYIDGLTSAVYLDRPADVARYAEALDHISAQAIALDRTVDTLKRIRKDITR